MEPDGSDDLLSAVIDDVHHALISASTTTELTQRICEQFAASPLYDHAWVGKYNHSTQTVIPKAAASIDPDTVGTRSLADESSAHPLLRHAIDTHTLQTNHDGPKDSESVSAYGHNLGDGSQSSAVLPFVYEETLYGVLALVADRPDVFDAAERTALSKLPERVGYALADIEHDTHERHQYVSEALDIEDGFLDTAIDSLSELFYIFDVDGTFIYWNDAFEAVTGYDAEEIRSMHPVDLFASDEIDRITAALQRVVNGERERVDATLVTKAGETIPIEATGTRFENEDGDVLGICGMAREITERKQRERQLARQRDQLATLKDQLLETVPTGVALFNAEGELTQFNNRTTQILGEPLDQLLDPIFEDPDWCVRDAEGNLIPESDFPINRVLETGEPVFNEELQLNGPHDEPVWLSVNVAPLSEQPRETIIVVAFEEITEQKRREQYLQDAKNQLEAATEAGAVGTWEWYIPDDEFITGASFARTFGVDPEAARKGVSLDRFVSAIHEADRERVERKIEEAMASCGEYEAEYRVWNVDDELRWVMARGHVECDSEGNPVRFPGALIDITERKQAEQALRESEEQLQTLIQLLPVGVLVANADGRLVKANEAAKDIWGGEIFDAENVAEYAKYSAWWADSGDPVEPEEWTLARVLQGEEIHEPDIYEIETVDGERRTIMAHGMPIYNANGEVSRGIATLIDITEREEREQRLQRQNTRLESFASMLAHELRNPLSIAQIYLSQAANGDAAAAEEVGTALDRIEEMIDILLVLTRGVDSEINPEPVLLAETATEVWSELDVPAEWLDIEADVVLSVEPHHLQHILENLFENAINHTKESVTVRVGQLADGFYVEDTGPGIPESERDDIFEAGYTTDSNGIGLGLTFITQLSEVYEWECGVTESTAGGARFEFRNVS